MTRNQISESDPWEQAAVGTLQLPAQPQCRSPGAAQGLRGLREQRTRFLTHPSLLSLRSHKLLVT